MFSMLARQARSRPSGVPLKLNAIFLAAVAIASLAKGSGAVALTSGQKRDMLPPREKTFLNIVFSGDEAKAVEYAQTAGVNPNAIGGDPLSAWFYRVAPVANVDLQRIVFGRFRQNPNPANVGDTALSGFCNMPNLPGNIRIEVQGSADEKAALQQQVEAARRGHLNNIMAGFRSLLGYGLKDKAILTEIFVGCLSNRMVPTTPENYDLVLAPMLKAGADIDGIDGQRPLLNAVRSGNPFLVERLVGDGADVDYHLPSGFGSMPYGQGPCQPRADQSLYGFVFDYVQTRNEEAALRIIRALAQKGLSPTKKWGRGNTNNCKYASLYDAVIDVGNLTYAARIKEIADGGGKQSSAPPAAKPADLGAKPPTVIAPVAAATMPLTQAPAPIGAWKFIVENGRPVAMAKREIAEGNFLAGLRIECAGGRLEYVPVALRLGAIQTLWVNGMNDITHTIPLSRGHVTGADNALLSKEFLGSETNYRRQGAGDNWGVEMSIDGPEAGMQIIKMAGFSQVRSLMLANCKT